ncbi:DedA family protein [Paenibacillus sp. MBLB4367]|uniref:DedA family protein n=1 Tax=Paenibacillus sp. MBLB4367 TaxID=3384767 RepID=UPI0039082B0D
MAQEVVAQWLVEFGYPCLFLLQALGVVGLPVPDELLMAFAGYLAYKEQLSYFAVALTAFLGSMCGTSISYWIGAKCGLPLIERWGRFVGFTPERHRRMSGWFEKIGKLAIPLGYFIPGVRHMTAYAAGMSRWTFRHFISYALPGAIGWVLLFTGLGYVLGDRWSRIFLHLNRNVILIAAAMLTAGLAWFLVRRYMAAKSERGEH